jgi:hypothetical protein
VGEQDVDAFYFSLSCHASFARARRSALPRRPPHRAACRHRCPTACPGALAPSSREAAILASGSDSGPLFLPLLSGLRGEAEQGPKRALFELRRTHAASCRTRVEDGRSSGSTATGRAVATGGAAAPAPTAAGTNCHDPMGEVLHVSTCLLRDTMFYELLPFSLIAHKGYMKMQKGVLVVDSLTITTHYYLYNMTISLYN